MPAFAVFPMRRKVKRPARLAFPLIVKSLSEDASVGIAQASVVDSDEKLAERVGFIHERIGTAAIAEQYIEGRELYVGVLGNDRLRVLPVWELEFGNMPHGARRIATEKVKHDPTIRSAAASCRGRPKDLSPEITTRIERLAKRICRTLELDGYARIDFRLVGRRHALFPRGQSPIPRSPRARNSPRPRCRRHPLSRAAQPHPGARHAPGRGDGLRPSARAYL